MGIFGVIFGIFWTVIAYQMTRNFPIPLFGVIFPLFGVGFVIMGIVRVVYNARNATAKDRFSTFDITTPEEESDPLNDLLGPQNDRKEIAPDATISSRLSKVEELKKKGLISTEEYLEQRERILSEI
tara:strand:- start:965 stop:1345 length:381 start_codon:yes stop_codon:yes gene_type:complete